MQLTREELDRLACWIDLLVPYGGDYVESNAWSAKELEKYQHFLAKRQQMQALEQRNLAEYVHSGKR